MEFPAEFEDEFKELQFALENSERGGWFFAVYKQWKVAEELIQRLRDSTQLPIFEWQYSQDKPSYPVDYLHDLTEQQKAQRAMVMLFHVASGGAKVIKSLDFNRERFSDYPHCLLFWVTETELREIANGAGHFWAQRGGRFDFSQVFIPEEQAQAPTTYSEWEGALLHIENAQEAEEQLPFYLNALQEQENGTENIALVELYDKVCFLLFYLGRYVEVIAYKQKALAIEERLFGDNDLRITNSLNNLGVAYHSQRHYEEALPLYQRALAIREKVLGNQHPNVANGFNNLATLYKAQGLYDEALPLHQWALAIREKTLGEQHPDVAISLNNLAELYYEQGRYDEALSLHRRAYTIRKITLGEQHPDVAWSLNNLASIYQEQGHYDKALPVFERALAILTKTLGKKHPETKNVAQNYAAAKIRANQSPNRPKKKPTRRSK